MHVVRGLNACLTPRVLHVELNLGYVNPNLAFPRSDRVRDTREHSTPPSSPFARRVHATLAIAPRPRPVRE